MSTWASREPGSLIIATPGQPDTKVWIDGKDSKRTTPVTPGDPLLLKPGRHTLTLRFADGRRLERTIDVRAGEMLKIIER